MSKLESESLEEKRRHAALMMAAEPGKKASQVLSDARRFEDFLSGEDRKALTEAVRAAARQFRVYEKLHFEKGTEEGKEKAAVNAEYARMLERFL